ncbi:hypothetical protein WR25_09306 [Diploscapter pachys]|uniref:Transmembrane protein 26 n=1 Tax=Diploscapter pachys TaxID=2018661 RepID=A0A2A2L546_9BILA|nr:hypothetical protein WR25_09306 [Diploscapter pachys]
MTSSSTPESRRARSTSPGNVNRIVAPRHRAPVLAPHSHVDSVYVFMAVGRAILARALFIVHSMATIIQTVRIEQNDSVWLFALISLIIVFEGSYTIIMRAGDERKWFCTSLLLYIVATAPPIWLLETKLCEWREDLAKDGKSDILIDGEEEELALQLLEQLLLVTLIIGRWLLPKGDISREQLSQILLAYLAISSDIVEFFDVFKEKVVYTDKRMQHIVLAAWTVRLYLMLIQGLVTYTMIFFTFKNALIIFFQTYRAFIIVNDRYIHPRPPEIDIYDNPHNRTNSRRHHSRKSPHSKSRKGIRGGGMKDDERQHLVANSSPRRNSQNSASTRKGRRRRSRSNEYYHRHELDTLEESAA